MRNIKTLLAASAALLLAAGAANAALPSYPTPGVENPTPVTFVAASSGDIIAYFAGQDAGDTEDLGLLINGVDTGLYGLSNHSTAVGASFNFGHADAGDALVFFIRDLSTGNNFYSKTSLNADLFNHAYATPYGGGDFGIPAGTFVAFEDILGGGDKDYNDETFVFQNVRDTKGGVPEPATWAMMLTGFGAAGAMMRRRRAAFA